MPDNPPAESTMSAIAEHWRNVAHDVHDSLAGKVDARKRAHVAGILDTFEDDLAPALAPLLQATIDHPATPPEVRDLLASMVTPEHFTTALLLGVAVAGVLQPIFGAVMAPVVQPISNAAWHAAAQPQGEDSSVPITPAEAAVAVLKGVLPQPIAGDLAAKSGISAESFDHLCKIAGQSLGYEEALLLDRQGLLAPVTLQQVLQYSNMNKLFYQAAENLRFKPLPAAEVITANLKGHINDSTRDTWLTWAGINPAYGAILRAAAGRPPGIEQMLHLRNRGDATTADVTNAVRQSDINDDFLEFVLKLGVYVPPVRSVKPMLHSGAIDEARARVLYQENGVRPEDVDAFLKEAVHASPAAIKELSAAQVVRMHTANLIDAPTALARLETLKYSPADAQLFIDYATSMRHEQLLAAAVRKIGALYVAHKHSKQSATNSLGAAGIPTAAQADLFTVWDIERDANIHAPTPSMVIGAFRREEITAAECKTRLLALGVQADDLGIFVADGWPPTKPMTAQAAATAVINA